MAAVSDGSGLPFEDVIDYELQRQLKELNTMAPDLSTLAHKGDDKVTMKHSLIFYVLSYVLNIYHKHCLYASFSTAC